MSIFTDVIIHFLNQGIDTIYNNSLRDDQSISQYARLSWFKQGRDLDLSKDKRNVLTALKAQIGELKNQNDNATFSCLREIMTQSHSHVVKLCKKKNKPQGNTGESLSNLCQFLGFAYDKICTDLKLADIPHNTEALNCIRYYSAMSCTHYLFEELFEKKWQDFQFIKDKEELLIEHLTLAAIDVNPPTNAIETNTRHIKVHAEAIQRGNDTINISYRFCIGGSLMNVDHLNKYMSDVISTLSCSSIAVEEVVEDIVNENNSARLS